MTVQFVTAVALSLILVTLIANLLVFSYARGVVRAALDEGARAGARATSGELECHARATAVLDGLVGGTLRASIGPVACLDTGDRMHARAQASLSAWLPGVPSWRFSTEAVAVRERSP